jgi:RimJ/RimL family protein N-acetyltransferase
VVEHPPGMHTNRVPCVTWSPIITRRADGHWFGVRRGAGHDEDHIGGRDGETAADEVQFRYDRRVLDRESTHSQTSICLRDVVASDLPSLYQQQLDPEANRMAVVNPRGLEAFNAHWMKIRSDTSIVAKAILVHNSVVGHVSCFKMDGQDSVGYWIAKEHWGRGIATMALALLLEQVAIRPLHARVARHNVASIPCPGAGRIQGYRLSPSAGR